MKKITTRLFLLLMLIASAGLSSYTLLKKQKKVLVFSKTAGFRHTSSIAAGKKYIIELGQKNKFSVDTTESANVFTAENLKQYATVVFLNTTGDVLNNEQ
ncbi:MAG: ThuA domain-containing protein, partial [Flavisolibacter sp.]